jgi:hypothetical protein
MVSPECSIFVSQLAARAQREPVLFVCRVRLDFEWRQDSWVQELASAFLSVNSGALLPVIPE